MSRLIPSLRLDRVLREDLDQFLAWMCETLLIGVEDETVQSFAIREK